VIFLSCTEKRKKERMDVILSKLHNQYMLPAAAAEISVPIICNLATQDQTTFQSADDDATRKNPIQLKSLFDPDHAARINCRLQNTNLEHQGLEELRSRRIGGSESLEGRSCCCCCCCAAAATATQNQQKQQQLQKEHCCATAAYFPTLTAAVRHPFTHRIFLSI
jgi:hypothetical protein